MSARDPEPRDPRSYGFRRDVELGAVRGLHGLFRLLPMPLAYGLAELGFLLFYRLSRYRDRALSSLQIAFGDTLPERERRKLLWRSVRYQAWFFLDFLMGPTWLRSSRRSRHLDLSAMEAAHREHVQRFGDKGAILVTGHLGMPEVASLLAALEVWPHLGLGRKLDNHRLWDWVLAQREGFNRPIIHRGGALWRSLRRVRSGGTVGLLNDQNAGGDGVFVPYFGRLASTHTGAATLAVHTGAPIYVMCCARTRPRRLEGRAEVRGPYLADPKADRDAEVHRLTARITADLEDLVRAHPEQALWAHRRWKTRPPGETAPMADPGSDSTVGPGVDPGSGAVPDTVSEPGTDPAPDPAGASGSGLA